MSSNNYSDNVFINIPFDDEYQEMKNALVFAIYDCGFVPRCALEESNGANIRLEKIITLMEESKYGIHDISRTDVDKKSKLPRFNMPLELGVFLGAKHFGHGKQKQKNCLIFDRDKYRYQKFISDISGQDICAHNNKPHQLIKQIRDWLNNFTKRKTQIPGGKMITKRYKKFKSQLPKMCKEIQIEIDELTFNDYSLLASEWLQKNPWREKY